MRRVFLHGGRDTSSTILLLKMVPLLPLEKAWVESRFTRRGGVSPPVEKFPTERGGRSQTAPTDYGSIRFTRFGKNASSQFIPFLPFHSHSE